MGEKGSDVARENARIIIDLNIVRGDFLTMRTVDESSRDTKKSIYTYAWSFDGETLVGNPEKLQPPQSSTLFDYQHGNELPEVVRLPNVGNINN